MIHSEKYANEYREVERIKKSLAIGITDPADNIDFLLSFIDQLGEELQESK